MKLKSIKINNLRDKLITTLILIVVLAVFKIFDIPCVFNLIFGIPCPSCGMTRSYINLLHFDIAGAFSRHPMFWSVPILGIYYFADWNIFKIKWIDYTVLILIGAGFLVNWIYQIVLAVSV